MSLTQFSDPEAPMTSILTKDELVQAHEDASTPPQYKAPKHWSEFVGPAVLFGLFIGFWYFMSYWGLKHIFGKPSFLLTAPHVVIRDSFTKWVNTKPLLERYGCRRRSRWWGW